jgi:hypothetical protein
MKSCALIFLTILVVCGCVGNRFPDAYSGFEPASREQAYWREVGGGKELIGELHLHSEGFSITYQSFEVYKDYWGTYTMGREQDGIRLFVRGGNRLPAFEEETGRITWDGEGEMSVDGIALDSRRPEKTRFRFERFDPRH